MDDNDVIGAVLLACLATIGVMFLLGTRFGYDDGVTDGKMRELCIVWKNQKNVKSNMII